MLRVQCRVGNNHIHAFVDTGAQVRSQRMLYVGCDVLTTACRHFWHAGLPIILISCTSYLTLDVIILAHC
jgi:hypothetical protein